MDYIYFVPTALCAGAGLWLILSAALFRDGGFSAGRWKKWETGNREKDIWRSPLPARLAEKAGRFVFLEPAAKARLERQLERAGIDATPEAFTARRCLIAGFAAAGAALCAAAKFWLGILLFGLLGMLLFMKQKEDLSSRLKARDDAVAMEMPRFVRTICRTLRSNRDVYAAMSSYRKVAGAELGAELDILLAHMRTGGVTAALQQFQKRLGTEEASRLCSALHEIDRGIDQSATLDYLAGDMARKARYRFEKTLAQRPAKMRRTYLPAVGLCVVLIIYVLIVFVTNQFNTLF